MKIAVAKEIDPAEPRVAAGKVPKRHIFALAAKTIAIEPQLGAGGLHQRVEALAIGDGVFLVRRPGAPD
jgi:hypothetical protein